MQGERWQRVPGGAPRPPVLPPPRPWALPVLGLRARGPRSPGSPGRGGQCFPPRVSKIRYRDAQSWASLPAPSHRCGASPLCVAEGLPVPWGGGDQPRCGGSPAGRWARLCPAALPVDPSTHHPPPHCNWDLLGVPHCSPPRQPHREFAAVPAPPPGLPQSGGGLR